MMHKFLWVTMGTTFLLAGCLQPATSNMYMLPRQLMETTDIELIDAEHAAMDTFFRKGPLRHVESEFLVDETDDFTLETIFLIKETMLFIQTILNESTYTRFVIRLEGEVLKTYVDAFETSEQVFSEQDARLFNDYVQSFTEQRNNIRLTLANVKLARRQLGSELRSLNHAGEWTLETLTRVYNHVDAISRILEPLPELYKRMLKIVTDAQGLFASYFTELNTPISISQRTQLTRLSDIYFFIQNTHEQLRDTNTHIRTTIRIIRDELARIQDQGLTLRAADETEFTLIRLRIREHIKANQALQRARRDTFNGLKSRLTWNQFDIIESALIQLSDMMTAHNTQAIRFNDRLVTFSEQLKRYS